MSGILVAAQGMTGESEEVSSRFTAVAAVVEETSASASEMSCAAGEVAASVQAAATVSARQQASVAEMVASSQELSAVAQGLEATAARFRVGDAPPERWQAGHADYDQAAQVVPMLRLRAA